MSECLATSEQETASTCEAGWSEHEYNIVSVRPKTILPRFQLGPKKVKESV